MRSARIADYKLKSVLEPRSRGERGAIGGAYFFFNLNSNPTKYGTRLHMCICAPIDIYVQANYIYYIDSVCRLQWRRTTAEKIIKYAKCKMQMPRDIRENGQKKKKKKRGDVYPARNARCIGSLRPRYFLVASLI